MGHQYIDGPSRPQNQVNSSCQSLQQGLQVEVAASLRSLEVIQPPCHSEGRSDEESAFSGYEEADSSLRSE
jgi:hypothetical protein